MAFTARSPRAVMVVPEGIRVQASPLRGESRWMPSSEFF
jgi:hypothetical protein